MDDISLVKSEPMADGTAYDEETVGMNSSSDTEDEDSCEAIINENNLIELTLEQTSKLSYPVGCPVWFKRHRHNDREVYSYGTIISVHMDLTSCTRKVYYRIKEKTKGGSHGSIGSYSIDLVEEDKVFYAAKCPVIVQMSCGDKKEIEGEIVCPRRHAYTVMMFREGKVEVEDGVVSSRIKFRSEGSTSDTSISEDQEATSSNVTDQLASQTHTANSAASTTTQDGDNTPPSKNVDKPRYQMVREGRVSGYPVEVTQEGSSRESKQDAILLGCNTENPQDFLNMNKDGMVKIRWKFAAYNDSVPTNTVRLTVLSFARESKGNDPTKLHEKDCPPSSNGSNKKKSFTSVSGSPTSASNALEASKPNDEEENKTNDDTKSLLMRTVSSGSSNEDITNLGSKSWIPPKETVSKSLSAEEQQSIVFASSVSDGSVDKQHTTMLYKRIPRKRPRSKSPPPKSQATSQYLTHTNNAKRRVVRSPKRNPLPPRPPGSVATRLFIGNLPKRADEGAIRGLFALEGVRIKSLEQSNHRNDGSKKP